jgi:hypothetical protein
MIDAIAAITGDEDVRFLPYSPDFKYNRIGLKSVPKPGMPEFEAEKNPAVKIDTLTWNDSMLNLSLTCRIPGTVKLDKDAKKFGFAQKYPTFIWRSYSVVKDGSANVTQLPLIISKDVFVELQDNGVIDNGQEWVKDRPNMLHLDRIPVMNRAIADGKTSAKEMCARAIEELHFEYKVNVLKKLKKALEAKGAVDLAARPAVTPEQADYLKKFYINFNGFQVPSESAPPKDWYMAKEFTIKIKSFSGVPKFEDVEAKQRKILQENGKGKTKLTPSETLMAESLKWVDTTCGRTNLSLINGTFSANTTAMRGVRKDIQKTKFAILLGKRWFDEFESREDCTIEVRGFTCTFNLREVRIDI